MMPNAVNDSLGELLPEPRHECMQKQCSGGFVVLDLVITHALPKESQGKRLLLEQRNAIADYVRQLDNILADWKVEP
jgi:hypothetical protein